ncbi:hypothetical protein [Rhodoflexus sp.]
MNHTLSSLFTKIYETAFSTVYVHEPSRILWHDYKPTTNEMTDADYKMELNLLVEHINSYNIRGLFSDTRDFFFLITPQLQEWTNNHLFGNIPSVHRIAVMVSPSFITQLSVEQTVDENTTGAMQTQFFSNVEQAFKWLGLTMA